MSISPWGDPPGWLQAFAEVGLLWMALRDRREQPDIRWVEVLQEELSGLQPEELRRVAEDEAVAGVVRGAWEAGVRTASDEKRRLFARLLAAALRGDAAAEKIQPLGFLLRTLSALEQEHFTLLAIIASPDGKERQSEEWMLQGKVPDSAVTREEIEERWSGAGDLLDPALAALEGARVVDAQLGYNGGTHSWSLNGYGRRFLDFIEGRESE
jgi:hypothetical protein